MMLESPKAIILRAPRPEAVQVAVERLAPASLGVIFSQDVLLATARGHSAQKEVMSVGF